MIILSELLAILSKDLNILFVDENDNEYTLYTLPVELLNRYVQIILPVTDGIEIRLFGEVNEYIVEDGYGNHFEYWTDGEYDIANMPNHDVDSSRLN